MGVNSIKPLQAPQIGTTSTKANERQPAAETQARERKDTLELSDQVQHIRDNQRTENLQRIQSQVNAGFYNRPEVVRETASRILRAFPREVKI